MTISDNLINSFIKATERAAYGASFYRGKKDKIAADQAAVDEMRQELNKIDMKGKIVIGEGEMDDAPMLYINEKVGSQNGEEFDIAVDPLEGTNFTAKNLPNALSVLAVAKKGNLLQAPDIYMEKIAIGPNFPKNLVDLDFDVKKNINLLSKETGKEIKDLSICVLDRPRHKKIIESIKSVGAKIKFISDGDVSGVISVGYKNSNIDMYIGIGGGPEGVLAAAALSCMNCQMQTRLVFQNNEEKIRAKKLGIKDFGKKYNIEDMVKDDVLFSATGVTDGDFVKGIEIMNGNYKSETLVLHKSTQTNKVVKNTYKK